jgi:hypothetical protein
VRNFGLFAPGDAGGDFLGFDFSRVKANAISINTNKHTLFITCNEKVEGSIPFSGTSSSQGL